MQLDVKRLDLLVHPVHDCLDLGSLVMVRGSLLVPVGDADGHEKFCDLVGVLNGSWYFDCASPVEVEVAQGVAQLLDFEFG